MSSCLQPSVTLEDLDNQITEAYNQKSRTPVLGLALVLPGISAKKPVGAVVSHVRIGKVSFNFRVHSSW